MNLPLPSGSSPPEKPPGRKTIWAFFRARLNRSVEATMPAADRLLRTSTTGSPPASRTALALSYSQLVPGNTGISTRGLATWTLALGWAGAT